jgi:apolipoprotein N-acyltransferase
VLWVASLPPFSFAEAAYVAFLPLLLWFQCRPGRCAVWLVSLGAGWAAWLAVLVWLRHVTVAGTVVLSFILALFFLLWAGAAAILVPRLSPRSFPVRLLGFAGLAGFWVVLEWIRTWFLWGFPWAPLALSQWERPVVLQLAAWTGAWGVSFLLVFFNLAVAQTLWYRIIRRARTLWGGWFSPDLYAALGCLVLAFTVFFRSLPAAGEVGPGFAAGVVQPYIPAELKWDERRELENLAILEQQTRFVAQLDNEVVVWPEAATPWPVVGVPEMRLRVEALARETGRPLLMGNLARLEDPERWYNGVFIVDPAAGLAPEFYAKRELVPFGEYVPLRRFIPFVEKVVPIGGDFRPGDDPAILSLRLGEEVRRIGALVCYEDIFPRLARASVRAGAEFLFVATNNAWYGEEGGAYQHAAHSVLRAVENRRPVLRCGNGGWSGWIDSYGTIRDVLRDGNGSIYFRGGGKLEVFQFDGWVRRRSFYTRHGDWFVVVSALLAAAGAGMLFRSPDRETAP